MKVSQSKKNLTKVERIETELSRLTRIFEKIPKDNFDTLEGVIEEAANIRVTMQDMRQELDATGWVEFFQQSKDVDPYERTRPLANQYNSMNKNYQNLIKMLKDSLPKEQIEEDDGFDDL